MTTTQTTLRQMVVRSNNGHRKALRAFASDAALARPGMAASELRGLRTVISTLHRWGACETYRTGPSQYETFITQEGIDLLEALDRR